MKIGIIGSQGYIGSYLYEQLKTTENIIYNFSKVFRNIEQTNFITTKGKDISIDTILNLDIIIYVAGISGIDSCNKYSIDELIQENVEDIYEVAKKMREDQLLIYLSTGIIFEGSFDYPAKENDFINDDLLTMYSKSYYMRERKMLTLENGPHCIGLRLGTVIGISPIQNITRIYIAMLRNVFLKGFIKVNNPNCMRSILWIKDLYDAIITIIELKNIKKNIIYNISSFNCSVMDISNEIVKYTKTVIKSDFRTTTKGFSLDNTLFSNDYNFKFRGNHDIIINELLLNIEHICNDDIKTLVKNSICRVCKSSEVIPILDLGNQPLANNFTITPIELKTFSLCLERCKECNHTQLIYTVPSEDMFSHYLYSSGTSRTIIKYFEWLAIKCIKESEKNIGVVLELASNDGSQLDIFKSHGWDTYGVDPAENLSIIAKEKGHNINIGFWGIGEYNIPTPDIIIAQNVLGHVPDPISFLQACVNIMDDNTRLYIQTSQCDMYVTGEFDTIYHEHLSFFTGHSFYKAAENVGLIIINFEITPIHGNSFLATMKKKQDNITFCDQILERIENEKKIGMYKNLFWMQYRNKAIIIKEWFLENVFTLIKEGFILAGYGAAAKGMTLLNFIDAKGIDFIVDDSPLKQNTFSPGQQIPILPTNKLSEIDNPLAIIVLAWNFFDEIIGNILNLRNGKNTIIIKPFPNQVIYKVDKNKLIEIISNVSTQKILQ